MKYIFALMLTLAVCASGYAAQLKDTTITGNGTVTGNLKVTGTVTVTNLSVGTGIVSTVGNETIVTYNTSSTFVVPAGVTSMKVLVVGGGAGGDGGVSSGVYGHGGGGGRVTYRSAFSVTAGSSHTVTIGTGGALGLQDNQASDGVQSVFGVITAAGGTKANNIGAGGDGGDSGNDIDTVITNYNGLTDSVWGGAGGAGAGGVGGTVSDAAGGTGGVGYSSSITGSSVVYGTGGDGSGTGTGAPPTVIANRGLGGHGGTPRNGGSGVVIVRFTTTNATMDIIGAITTSGIVGIGTSTPATTLHVIGTLTVSSGIVVAGSTMTVPDYVFDESYKLMPLDELQEYIEINKHLPAFKSDIKDLNLVADNMALRKTIEELTLYILQIKNEINLLKLRY